MQCAQGDRYSHAVSVKRQRNTLLVVVAAIGVAAVGIALIWVGTLGTEWWHFGATQLGTAVLVSAGLGLLWDMFGRRLLADEIMEKMNVGLDVQRWGLRSLAMEWTDPKWAELFAQGPNVDIVVAYGQTWRGVAATGLETFLASKSNRLRVCLPDPREEWLMIALSHRFNLAPERVAERIYEAARYFAEFRDRGEAAVQIYFRPGEPLYGLYRFESVAVLTLYPHRKDKGTTVPTFMMGSGQFLDFAKLDFESAIGVAREASDDEFADHGEQSDPPA